VREVFEIAPGDVEPTRGSILPAIGMPPGAEPTAAVEAALDAAFGAYRRHARPRAIVQQVDSATFGVVLAGEGRNAEPTPVRAALPAARALVLFAATLGHGVSEAITRHFARRELVEGTLLDAVASAAADRTADEAARRALHMLVAAGDVPSGTAALPYSPGYCGWHVSGQGRLFAELEPGEIGIALRPSFLMEPLKSVSGVIVLAAAEALEIDPEFPACAECSGQECRDRMPLT
jgi:hypothetical protein